MNPGGSNPYDTAGNMTSWNGANGYSYGPFNETWRVVTSNQEWVHVYTADDERLFSYEVGGGQLRRWALRGLDNRVLREYTFVQNAPSGVIERDNIYRGSGPLLAAATPAGDRHYHVDHLGTPRQITDATGAQVAFHTYYPYGEEATSPTQDTVRFKFTGHERDLADPTSTQDDLDHMHARMTNPKLGRFLSIDPVGGSPGAPQSWNRYSYAVGNPIKFVDPDGEAIHLAVALAAAEATATTFDIKQTADVLGDPEASNALKATTAGLLLLGAVTPGGGYTALGDEIVDAAKLLRQNYVRGNAFEEAGRSALQLSKNRELLHVPGISRGTIPDSLTRGVTEFKDRIKVTNTLQLRLQAAIAGIKGVPFNLVVSPRTTAISESVQQAVGRSGGTIHVFDPGTDTLLLWKNNKQ